MRNAVQSRTPFVIRLNDIPWGFWSVRRREHRVTCSRIIIPAAMRLQIHRAKLPDVARIIDARGEPARLFVLAYLNPILNQGKARVDDILFPGRTYLKESIIFFVRTKSHHSLHAGSVIPAPVENDNFTRRRKMFEIALKIYLGALPLGRSRESNHPKYPMAHPLSDSLDSPTFPGRVSAFKKNNNQCSGMLYPKL